MTVRLRLVEKQVVVLTGASSGIGLATARALADRGARLVLVARNKSALQDLARECSAKGARAIAVAGDVGRFEDMERVAEATIREFGGFDTWINNAGVAIFGTVEQVPIEDHRRLFDTNYFGVLYGCLIAAKHLRQRGGKIINIGSVLSDRADILQGPYSASKHAVKGLTDALRMELEEDGAPISVTLIKPSAIDTPYMEHARSYMTSPGTKNPPPSYDPEVAARAIVFACENDRRDIVVGFGGWALAAMGSIAPRLTDYAMEVGGRILQESTDPGRPERRDNLHEPREDGAERSSLPGGSRKTSLFLEAQLNPVSAVPGMVLSTLAGAGLAALRKLRPVDSTFTSTPFQEINNPVHEGREDGGEQSSLARGALASRQSLQGELNAKSAVPGVALAALAGAGLIAMQMLRTRGSTSSSPQHKPTPRRR
ncbi:SDR family oxidoreductase [Microvirga makkahensis]|uniref:SDR family NAD(P)-dependent oxidoreductase n=1 Tax=Microvirga makkahensis TaxID=1128670 RepID=A0A7X3SQQ1_9HYPH|nr:SDR family oxidoreductase [Microvirga makkahensis]MXQ13503.1 SDR family NAD(P)-dependent oxidoreductase [Microvirga makkahensis]